jgi:hypothetical protein
LLLRIPPGSFKEVKAYAEKLRSQGYDYWEVVTRISFDPAQAFPVLQFNAIRAIEDEDTARAVLELRADSRVATILSEPVEEQADSAEQPPAQEPPLFEQAPAQPRVQAQAATQHPAQNASPRPAQAPVRAPDTRRPAPASATQPSPKGPTGATSANAAPVQDASFTEVHDQGELAAGPDDFERALSELLPS